ncbi:hypothetical protein CCP3SC15_6190001 [Gammaproteobacteria bacterium]
MNTNDKPFSTTRTALDSSPSELNIFGGKRSQSAFILERPKEVRFMKRLYFLLPTPRTACQTVTELAAAGVRVDHIHAVASYGSELECVHQATLLQTSQFGRGIGLGLLVGGLAGLLGGWLAIAFPPPSLQIGMRGLVLCGVIGAMVGAILGGILAQDRLNPEILPYEGAILRGAVLLMVDIPRSEVAAITELVQRHHPEAIPHITPSPRTPTPVPVNSGFS